MINIKKKCKTHVVLFMIMTLLLTCLTSVKSVKAWDESTPYEFTKIKEIDYPEWWSRKAGIKKWSTYMCKYKDHYAYCLESSKNSPSTGNYPAKVINDNESVRKLLYYGFGGPGYNEEIRNIFKAQMLGCVPNDFGEKHGNFDEGAYLFTHIWLSYAYCGDLMGLSLEKFNELWPGYGGYGNNVLSGYRDIMNLPDPGSQPVNFDGDTTAKFVAKYDVKTGQQITNTVTFNGSQNATANIPLQDNVTIHVVGSEKTQTGGTFEVHGGESFYLTIAEGETAEDFKSNNVAGSGCEAFSALAIATGSQTTQTEGTWQWDPDVARLYVEETWLKLGNLRLSKVDNSSNFHSNSEFRLISTSFDGFDRTYKVTKDQDGDYELLIKGLPEGTYTLTETKSHENYAPIVASWQVTILNGKTTKKVVVNTLRPTGTFQVKKVLQGVTDNVKDVSNKDITKTHYKITAKNDIIDTVTLKKLYSKGDGIEVGSGKCVVNTADGNTMTYSQGVVVTKGTNLSNGCYGVNQDGELELSGLPIGQYLVKEISCPEGYVLENAPREISITQKDYVTEVYFEKMTQMNEITKILISKQDVVGQELEGASMQVLDKEGNIIDKWISTNISHEIDGLKVGSTYILHEDLAPIGYNVASDIEFKIENDGKVQKVNMIDTVTTIKKVDEDGNILSNAKLQIISTKTKNIVDQWQSDEKEHVCEGLIVGETYILKELEAPVGYAKSDDIEFTVSDTINQSVKMVDQITKVDISKVDATTSKELEGAHMYLKDKESDEILEKWISTNEPHRITGLEVGKTYILHEDLAPVGYLTANDVEFTIKDTGEVQKIIMKDELKPVIKTGDDTHVYWYSIIGIVSIFVLLGYMIIRKRQGYNK